jgi:hypothetical protein
MIFKKDNLKLGLVLGLVGPIAGLVIVYYTKFSAYTFKDFLEYFINDKRLMTSMGSLSLLANVVLFTIYVNTHRDETAKGIFVMTMLYGIAILLLKLFN